MGALWPCPPPLLLLKKCARTGQILSEHRWVYCHEGNMHTVCDPPHVIMQATHSHGGCCVLVEDNRRRDGAQPVSDSRHAKIRKHTCMSLCLMKLGFSLSPHLLVLNVPSALLQYHLLLRRHLSLSRADKWKPTQSLEAWGGILRDHRPPRERFPGVR